MILHRITTKAYARDLSGTGAMLYGGRWNRKGVRVLYTSESLSLSALETIANMPSNQLGLNLYCIEINFPKNLEVTTPETLPDGWNSFPYTAGSVALGTDFFKGGGLCLKLPSAIIPTEYNFLLNPLHEDFDKVRVTDVRPLILDQRLIK